MLSLSPSVPISLYAVLCSVSRSMFCRPYRYRRSVNDHTVFRHRRFHHRFHHRFHRFLKEVFIDKLYSSLVFYFYVIANRMCKKCDNKEERVQFSPLCIKCLPISSCCYCYCSCSASRVPGAMVPSKARMRCRSLRGPKTTPTCKNMNSCVCLCMCVYEFVYVYVHVYVRVCVCICVYMCVCVRGWVQMCSVCV